MPEKMVAVPMATLQLMGTFLSTSPQDKIYEALQRCGVIEDPTPVDDKEEPNP